MLASAMTWFILSLTYNGSGHTEAWENRLKHRIFPQVNNKAITRQQRRKWTATLTLITGPLTQFFSHVRWANAHNTVLLRFQDWTGVCMDSDSSVIRSAAVTCEDPDSDFQISSCS